MKLLTLFFQKTYLQFIEIKCILSGMIEVVYKQAVVQEYSAELVSILVRILIESS